VFGGRAKKDKNSLKQEEGIEKRERMEESKRKKR
jgi:hypothetical protein